MADQPNCPAWAFECRKLLDQLYNEIARPRFARAQRTRQRRISRRHDPHIGGVPRPSPLGYMFGGNAEAAADSFAMTEAFLAARLKVK